MKLSTAAPRRLTAVEQAIHLNHWHSLRKQVRRTQKEKLALRDEILRLRGEREQVALRMDAVRIKHEADSNESTVSRARTRRRRTLT